MKNKTSFCFPWFLRNSFNKTKFFRNNSVRRMLFKIQNQSQKILFLKLFQKKKKKKMNKDTKWMIITLIIVSSIILLSGIIPSLLSKPICLNGGTFYNDVNACLCLYSSFFFLPIDFLYLLTIYFFSRNCFEGLRCEIENSSCMIQEGVKKKKKKKILQLKIKKKKNLVWKPIFISRILARKSYSSTNYRKFILQITLSICFGKKIFIFIFISYLFYIFIYIYLFYFYLFILF